MFCWFIRRLVIFLCTAISSSLMSDLLSNKSSLGDYIIRILVRKRGRGGERETFFRILINAKGFMWSVLHLRLTFILQIVIWARHTTRLSWPNRKFLPMQLPIWFSQAEYRLFEVPEWYGVFEVRSGPIAGVPVHTPSNQYIKWGKNSCISPV